MIKFEKIKPGMTLYDVRKTSGLARFGSKWSTYYVHVIEVNAEKRTILASWNGNEPKWMSEYRATKLRANPPKES